MAHRIARRGDRFFVDADTHPQTIAVLATRAEPIGSSWSIGDPLVDLDPASVFGALLPDPGSSGVLRDLAAQIGALHARRRRRRRHHRPARLRVGHPTRGARRRHRRRLRPTIRCPDGLRWSARRVPRRPSGRRPLTARSPRRRLDGHRRPAGTASRLADSRAAHPTGEGDVQHLHCAGAAGQHRRVLRHLPRSRRAAADRRADPPADVDPRRRPAFRWRRRPS